MTTTNQVTRMLTVGVPVRDQDRAMDFYSTVLGLTKQMDVPIGGGARWIELTPPSGGTTIALTLASPDTPAGVETGIRFLARDADALHADLRAGGVDVDEVLRWPGVPPMFAFRDADGNGMEIVEQR